MNETGMCWPCRHGEHEDCTGHCFCPTCWDNEDRCVVDDAHDLAIKIKVVAETGG